MPVHILNNPIPEDLLLSGIEIQHNPLPNQSDMVDEGRMELGYLTPNELALHELISAEYRFANNVDRIGIDKDAPLRERPRQHAVYLQMYAVDIPRQGVRSLLPAIRTEIYNVGAYAYVAFHPARNEAFDVAGIMQEFSVRSALGAITIEQAQESVSRLAKWIIPDAERMSSILDITSEARQEAALVRFWNYQLQRRMREENNQLVN